MYTLVLTVVSFMMVTMMLIKSKVTKVIKVTKETTKAITIIIVVIIFFIVVVYHEAIKDVVSVLVMNIHVSKEVVKVLEQIVEVK